MKQLLKELLSLHNMLPDDDVGMKNVCNSNYAHKTSNLIRAFKFRVKNRMIFYRYLKHRVQFITPFMRPLIATSLILCYLYISILVL